MLSLDLGWHFSVFFELKNDPQAGLGEIVGIWIDGWCPELLARVVFDEFD